MKRRLIGGFLVAALALPASAWADWARTYVVEWNEPAMYYGAKSGEFGFGVYATRNGSFPLPWGDIPARPFLGASEDDKANIVRLVQSYLSGE